MFLCLTIVKSQLCIQCLQSVVKPGVGESETNDNSSKITLKKSNCSRSLIDKRWTNIKSKLKGGLTFRFWAMHDVIKLDYLPFQSSYYLGSIQLRELMRESKTCIAFGCNWLVFRLVELKRTSNELSTQTAVEIRL